MILTDQWHCLYNKIIRDRSKFIYKVDNGKIIVKDIDVNGTEHLKDLLKADTKVVTIFLRVPKEDLEARLQERIDKPSPAEIRLRLSRFEYEESKINLYDYVLKNDNLEKTVQIVMAILENELKLENDSRNNNK